MKLLLIEDERNLAISIQTYLTDKHFVCEQVKNMNDVIDKILIYEYDSIILELLLPDGSGFKILKKLEKQKKLS